MSLDAPVSVRVPHPYEIVRGQAATLTAPLFRSGSAVAATGVTSFALYDAANQEVTLAASPSVVADIASQAIGASELDSYDFDDGWRVEWVITTASETINSRHGAALVRSGLHPVVSDSDLYQLHAGLEAGAAAAVSWSARSTYQTSIDAAWRLIMHRLRRKGNRPALIMSPDDLYDAHLYLTLSLVFNDIGGAESMDLMTRADDYYRRYEAAWGELVFDYDADDDGQADDGNQRAAASTVWLA